MRMARHQRHGVLAPARRQRWLDLLDVGALELVQDTNITETQITLSPVLPSGSSNTPRPTTSPLLNI